MSQPFSAEEGLIVLPVEFEGPSGSVVCRLALDTGATHTIVSVALLVAIGFDPSAEPDRIEVTTGSGVEFAMRVQARQVDALGRSVFDFPVLGHTLPRSAGVDGLLGLDFFRGTRLVVDFCSATIELT